MRRPYWQVLPLLLLTFLASLAYGTAQDAQQQDVEHQQPLEPAQDTAKSAIWQDALPPQKGADSFREATSILRKIKSPTVSKIAWYTHRPKGMLGTTIYYAKEAFVLLFMNSPKSIDILPSTTQSAPKVQRPLSTAVKLLDDAAREGNADALFLLAEMNFYGNFTHPINYAEAFRKYELLAEMNGNSTAQHRLAFMYATGLNTEVPADQAKSLLYHTFAAEQGNTRSEMTLAYRYHAGISTPRNCDEAVHWYKKVADKALAYYRAGPPGGHVLVRNAFRLADEEGGVYGEGASASSAGMHAKQGGPTSDAQANIDDVIEYLDLQSSKGEIRSTFNLARLYYDGSRGLRRDLKLAKRHFLSLARLYWTEKDKVKKDVTPLTEKLATKSAGYLGRMFLRGEGMEQSFSKARIWFTRGISNGDALSQYSLGLMYLHGLGVNVDVAKAADLLAAAADQDLAVAQTNLGMLFLDQGDTRVATQYFELAARNSHIEAFYYLAEMNDKAIGRDRSCGMAAVYYKIVAEKAEAVWSSLHEANDAYEDGDTHKAFVGYLMAAEQGSENSQANVAWLLDHTKPRWSPIAWVASVNKSTKAAIRDAGLALQYWTRSAKQNNIDSLVKMGDYYLSGLGTSLSPENAAACYQAATEIPSSAQAMWNLGWMHENGVGIDQDFHLAKRFYDQALETNKEAYLPVQMSLWKLRWRSWWNDVTRGGIHGIEEDEPEKTRRSFAEWLQDFLEADAQYYEQHYEPDDWDTHDPMPGGDEYYGEDFIDDGVLETLLIGGLVAALGWLIYYRQQQQRAAEQRRRQDVQNGQQGQAGAVNQQLQQAPAAPDQQPDAGFFPQPGDPNWNAWAAGGVGH